MTTKKSLANHRFLALQATHDIEVRLSFNRFIGQCSCGFFTQSYESWVKATQEIWTHQDKAEKAEKGMEYKGSGWIALSNQNVKVDGILYVGYTKQSEPGRDTYTMVGKKELCFRDNTPWPTVVECIREEVWRQNAPSPEKVAQVVADLRQTLKVCE